MDFGKETTRLLYDPNTNEFKKIVIKTFVYKNTDKSTLGDWSEAVKEAVSEIVDHMPSLEAVANKEYDEQVANYQAYGWEDSDSVSYRSIVADILAGGFVVSSADYEFILETLFNNNAFSSEIMNGLKKQN